MKDLITFIRARLDEAEQRAVKDLWCVSNTTSEGQWQAHAGHNLPRSYLRADGMTVATFVSQPLADGEEDPHMYDAELACRLVSAAKARAEQVLLDVAAKRATVRRCEARMNEMDAYPNGLVSPRAVLARQVLIDTGSAYAAHPDYRPDWAP